MKVTQAVEKGKAETSLRVERLQGIQRFEPSDGGSVLVQDFRCANSSRGRRRLLDCDYGSNVCQRSS
jgi:hypothetical protein